MKTITEKLDEIRKTAPNGVVYWRGRELMSVLGYESWRRFEGVILRAIEAFSAGNEVPENHFAETVKKVQVGSDAVREVTDYYLDRPACYIIAMNGDARKSEIAEAQKYYAIKTRQMEKIERALVDLRRIDLRDRVQNQNSNLSGTAKEIGVQRFGVFHGSGIRAMYDMPLRDLKERRGLSDKENWLDYQDVEELAANEFRITQTDAKLKRETVSGETAAIRTHEMVGHEVRDTIRRLGNTMPEDWPVAPPIKEIRKRLRPTKATNEISNG